MTLTTTIDGRLLLTRPPDLGRDAVPQSQAVDMDTFIGDSGTTAQQTRLAVPNFKTSINYLCVGRDEIAEMEDFLNAVAGRAYAFWLPSFADDLWSLSGGFTTITIRSIGYAANLFPYQTYRNLWTWPKGNPAGGVLTTLMFSAVDNGDGTETLNGMMPGNTSATHRFSFAWLVRLDSDEIEMEYYDGDKMEITLPLFQVPEG